MPMMSTRGNCWLSCCQDAFFDPTPLAIWAQLRGAQGAVKQRRVEKRLELLHTLGNRRLRGVEPGGRLREAAKFHDPVDGFKLFERQHKLCSCTLS